MTRSGIASLEELAERSQVSTWQLHRVEAGLLARLSLENTVKLANALQVSITELIATLCPQPLALTTAEGSGIQSPTSAERDRLQQEYHRLEKELVAQKAQLTAEFQQSALDTLEFWLLQWPTAAAMAQQNPQLSAVKLLALIKPVNDLLKRWGVETIGVVGESLSYDPRYHQLIEGSAEVGDHVWVRYVGYQQANKLLYRAKVSSFAPVLDTPEPAPPLLQRPNPVPSNLGNRPIPSTPSLEESSEGVIAPKSEPVPDPWGADSRIAEAENAIESLTTTEGHTPSNPTSDSIDETIPDDREGEHFHEDFMEEYPDSRGTRVYFYD
jgi:transcriptional regulator with XRE-family HTH domain